MKLQLNIAMADNPRTRPIFDQKGTAADRGSRAPLRSRHRQEPRSPHPAVSSRPWRIGVRNPPAAAGDLDRVIELEEMALAESGGYGTTFEPGRFHHLFDPQSGASTNRRSRLRPAFSARNGRASL
jgi:hypothetical protein